MIKWPQRRRQAFRFCECAYRCTVTARTRILEHRIMKKPTSFFWNTKLCKLHLVLASHHALVSEKGFSHYACCVMHGESFAAPTPGQGEPRCIQRSHRFAIPGYDSRVPSSPLVIAREMREN